MSIRFASRAILVILASALTIGSFPTAAEITKEQERRLRATMTGLALAIAIKKAKKERDRERQWERYERNGHYYYNYDWGPHFSPKKDVVCYRRTRQCFKDGYYSAKWTARSFGY